MLSLLLLRLRLLLSWQVRGPIVVERYHKATSLAVDGEGWFMTGDVASIDEHGLMRIADRCTQMELLVRVWLGRQLHQHCA